AVLAWALFGIAKATEPPNPITDYVRQCAAIEHYLHSMPTGCYASTSNYTHPSTAAPRMAQAGGLLVVSCRRDSRPGRTLAARLDTARRGGGTVESERQPRDRRPAGEGETRHPASHPR